MLTIAVKVSHTNPAYEKALRLHPAQNAPQGVPTLRAQIQTRLRHSEDMPKVPSRNAPMRMRVRTNDSLNAEVRARSQPPLRKALEETNEALRVRVWNCDPGIWTPTFHTPAIREWPQQAKPPNRALASSAGPALCLWMWQADQTESPSVEARRVSLHFGPQSGRARRSTLWMEGGLFTSQAASRESQGLYSLASSSSQAGPLYLPEVRCQKEFGSRSYGRLFRDRCEGRRRSSGNPRLSHRRDRRNPLSQMPSRQGYSLGTPPSENPSDQVLKADQRFQISVSRSADREPRNLNARLPLKSTAKMAQEEYETIS
jgi:hypothetical protein